MDHLNTVQQHIQVGDDANPTKLHTEAAYSTGHKDPSFSDKEVAGDADLEERAVRIAEEDLNHKKQTYKG